MKARNIPVTHVTIRQLKVGTELLTNSQSTKARMHTFLIFGEFQNDQICDHIDPDPSNPSDPNPRGPSDPNYPSKLSDPSDRID